MQQQCWDKAKQLIASFNEAGGHSEQLRKCPICLKKMAKVAVGEGQPVLLDRCKKGHGLWFDSGELEEICTKAKLDEDSKIVKLLADFFGKNE